MTAHSAAGLHGIMTDPSGSADFRFEGRVIPALPGQTIAAALYAAGVRVFSRSFKYHRPRGLFCVSGDCPNCLMQVDGRPNVRTCIEPARPGQVVSHQHAWPSLDFDVLRVFDKLDRFLPVGFYYRRFHRPRWLWPIFEHTVRHLAGRGRIDVRCVPEAGSAVEHLRAEICVVGGGRAGLAAAEAAAAAGASVLVLERQATVGGSLLELVGSERSLAGTVYASKQWTETEQSLRNLRAHPRIQVRCETPVFGFYEGNVLGAFCGNRLLKIRGDQIIICTGGRERSFVFQNNDLPGVMLGRGALRLAWLYQVLPGRRAVILTDHDGGAWLAEQLGALGVEVAAVVDRRAESSRAAAPAPWPWLRSSTVLAARGRARLKAVRVAKVRSDGTLESGTEQEIACDLVCLASRIDPANELLLMAGMRFRHNGERWVPTKSVPGILAAGAAAGTLEAAAQLVEGRLCGAAAAAALGYSVPALPDYEAAWQAMGNSESVAGSVVATPPFPYLAAQLRGRKQFICLCEDVTEKDLEQAMADGFDEIETLKRYSTVNMGPCQGKMCGRLAVEFCARATGRDSNAVGATTSRPPVIPVELGVLAAGAHHPVRRTPLHHWHQAAGATWTDAGQWKRPEHYGEPLAEARAVRNGVGLIDVSTLGKIEVTGPDAAELLERVYLNKWADLKVGRVRYGVMCDEDGILFDDGVCARLGPDRFYLTATTGNAETVFQWLELWKATWQLDVTVLHHTSGTAAMNLTGPRSRELLSRLSPLGLSAAAFPYMALREGDIAGVRCRLLRIGFVGELGYEIHCPAAHAWGLWEAICEAGRAFDLKPFGVEAQRILRLEKGHLIIGVDTDALSNPLEAGLEWLIRFDKPRFIGREPLVRLKAMGPRSRLVGFLLNGEFAAKDDAQLPSRERQGAASDRSLAPPPRTPQNSVPPVHSIEGCQIVERGRPVGRVTSARHSPTLQRCLALGWVPAPRSKPGERWFVRWNGADVPAVIVSLPFYDPDGIRLKM